MPTLLERLVVEEISLVDRPANAGAKVLIVKRHGAQGGSEMAEVVVTKRDVYEQISEGARKIKKADETFEAAFARFCRTEEGNALYRQYRGSPGSALPEQPAPPVVKRATDEPYRKLAALAVDRQRTQGGSFEANFAAVYGDPANRDLVATYKSAAA